MKIIQLSLVLLLVCNFYSCGYRERVEDKLYQLERGRVEKAVKKLSSGSRLLGSFSGVSKVWLIENCRMIPTQGDSRSWFVIGEEGWDDFVILTVAGDLGFKIALADFKTVVVSDKSDQLPASLRGARINHVGWAKVVDGTLVYASTH